ncbi:MAG TPA: RagB/SusD family nutrient uptake outer membrane protein [Longimicrobiales bacterium]
MKGKQRRSALALSFALLVALPGCDDGFLDTVPPDQLSDAVFWKQEKDAVLAVNAIYPLLSGWDYLYFDAATDNAWAQKSFSDWYHIGNGTADASNGTVANIWYNAYRAIRRANEVLANIDKIEKINPDLKERLRAEALFHRAYHYTMLANLYGDVPLILQPISIADAVKVTRTPRAQVINQVLKDLDQAAPALPTAYGSADLGRATRGAALALKARAALWESRWDVAAEAAKAVMDLGVYSLHPNYADLFRYAGEDSPEIIYADRRLKGQRSHSAFSTFGPRSLQGGSDVVPLRSLVDAYYMTDGLPITESPLYDPANPYANRDPRMYGTLLYPGAVFAGQVYNSLPDSPTPDRVGNDFNATQTGYQFIKYVDPADRNEPNNSGIDLIVMRYAEVLLTYVEAKLELNQVDASVLEAFNAVRRRAGMPEVATAAELTRDLVRNERRVEFAGEGLRLFDIRRWRIAEQVMPGQSYGIDYVDEDGNVQKIPAANRRFTVPRDYLWPIPLKELDLNPGLGQNPGY